MAYKHTFNRHKTRKVKVGNIVVGGDNPIWVQSMTTPDTYDVEATVAQILRLEEAGCEIVRVTVPKPQDAAVLSEIKKRIHIPLICDIHFDYKMALSALDHPVDKIRINPGNIGGYDRYRQVIRKAKNKGLPMRIGVNAGSLEREMAEKYGFPCPPAMVDSALRYLEIAEAEHYHDIIVSLKSSDVLTAVEAYRLYAKQANYPTHIGITEAGKALMRSPNRHAAWRRFSLTASATRSESVSWATRSRKLPPRSTSCRLPSGACGGRRLLPARPVAGWRSTSKGSSPSSNSAWPVARRRSRSASWVAS